MSDKPDTLSWWTVAHVKPRGWFFARAQAETERMSSTREGRQVGFNQSESFFVPEPGTARAQKGSEA